MDNEKKLLLTQYATAHGLVDLICGASLFTLWHEWQPGISGFMLMLLIYNILAFGLQAPAGICVDKANIPKEAAIVGCWLVALGVIFISISPWLTIVFVGLGNAIFHVGGGSVSLNLTPYKATAPGIFVAPGAIGLTLGILIGQGDAMYRWAFVAASLVMGFILLKIPIPRIEKIKVKKINNTNILLIILLLLLLVVYIRALIGFSLSFSWKQNVALLITLAIAISAGKGVGGLIAEKFGWIKTGLFGLIVSVPFLVFTPSIPLLVIFGAFLFQFTMPITLTAMYKIFPRNPAFAFGLPCSALLLGALPTLLGYKGLVGQDFLIIFFAVIAAMSLYLGLHMLNRTSR